MNLPLPQITITDSITGKTGHAVVHSMYVRELEAAFLEYEAALLAIATPMRPDGTYNLDRTACKLRATEVLARNGKTAASPFPKSLRDDIKVYEDRGDATKDTGLWISLENGIISLSKNGTWSWSERP